VKAVSSFARPLAAGLTYGHGDAVLLVLMNGARHQPVVRPDAMLDDIMRVSFSSKTMRSLRRRLTRQ